MVGHSDITKDGRPVGRAIVDTDKKEMTILVLRSVSESLYQGIVSAFMGGSPEGITVKIETIDDDHFFDLFTTGGV